MDKLYLKLKKYHNHLIIVCCNKLHKINVHTFVSLSDDEEKKGEEVNLILFNFNYNDISEEKSKF